MKTGEKDLREFRDIRTGGKDPGEARDMRTGEKDLKEFRDIRTGGKDPGEARDMKTGGRKRNMAAAYVFSIIMALFAGTLPVQILGVLWEQICDGMSIEIPYIALMRLLGTSGAIAAVILSDRIRGYILARDIIVGALALESMALIGFSMSRVFWNLAVWIIALGFAFGLSLSLICYLLREISANRAGLMFSSSACGIAAGAVICSRVLAEGRNWRTACQILAIIQIVLCMIIFFMRRTLLKDVVSIVRTQRREAQILRERRRKELIQTKGNVDERFESAYLVRLLSLYGCALCCGMILLSAVHLTFAAQAASGDESADIVRSILTVCAAMAVGRVFLFLLRKSGWSACWAGTVITLVSLGGCMASGAAGYDGAVVLLIARIGAGFGAGMVFPNLIQHEDPRFDVDAMTSMAGLMPAFYFGAGAVITPFVQSLSGASRVTGCVTAMFVLSCCMCVLLALGTSSVKRK